MTTYCHYASHDQYENEGEEITSTDNCATVGEDEHCVKCFLHESECCCGDNQA